MGGTLNDTVPLTTNDPDHPTLSVAVTGSAHLPPMPDSGPPDAGPRDAGSDGGHVGYTTPPGCGCSVASRPAPTLALLALGLVLAARRRRR
jgi:MYXO-CTERM domain-containing protein